MDAESSETVIRRWQGDSIVQGTFHLFDTEADAALSGAR